MTTIDRLTAALEGRYRVTRELGQGGMATVYLAHDLKHERDVAIKVLHPDLGAALGADRFLSEIKTTARLQHPHILPLLDSGVADALLYYVMPYVNGETLRARLDREGQLSIPDALRIAREVASALDHAHKQGIIHRDIKPENILLQDGAAVVADFGIALAVQQAGGQRMTQTGLSLGTPQYMSPEQAMGERIIDARSDIYAIGAVTYEMLAGEPPFSGPSTQAIVAKILTERPLPLATLRDTVSPAIESAIMMALSRAAADRPASAAAFADALTRGGDAVPPARIKPQHKTRMPMVVAVAVLAALTSAAATWWYMRGAEQPAFNKMQRLTDDEGVEASPSISPDGKTLAYASARAGSWDVYVQRVGGRNATRITPDSTASEEFPAFSPDGERIAYASSAGGLWVVEASGENAKRVAPRGYASSWSPDGKAIVYELEASRTPLSLVGNGGLEIVDVTTGRTRPLQTGGLTAYQPSWSPNGHRIAMMVVNGSRRDIMTVAADGGNPIFVTDDEPFDIAPEWSPDGRWLYFASNRGGAVGIWRIAIDEKSGAVEGAPMLVANGAESDFDYPRIARTTGQMVFRSRTYTSNPAVADLDGAAGRMANVRQLTDRTMRFFPSAVSADGRTLILSALEPPYHIWLLQADGTQLRQLTSDDHRNVSPTFASDGRVVFQSNRTGTNEVYRIAADGSTLEPLTQLGGAGLLIPVFFKDGRRLIAAQRGGPTLLMQAPFPVTSPAQVSILKLTGSDSLPFLPSSLSPDQRLVAGFRKQYRELVIYDVAEQRIVLADSAAGGRSTSWLPDSRQVAVNHRDGSLVLLDVATGRSRVVQGWMRGASPGNIIVSPDGKKLYHSVIREEANIWLIEGASRQ